MSLLMGDKGNVTAVWHWYGITLAADGNGPMR